jgi:hypothetical protein
VPTEQGSKGRDLPGGQRDNQPAQIMQITNASVYDAEVRVIHSSETANQKYLPMFFKATDI